MTTRTKAQTGEKGQTGEKSTPTVEKPLSGADETKELVKKVLAKCSAIEGQLKAALDDNKKLKEDAIKRDETIATLNRRVDVLEQRSRINNIEISNFPVTQNENLVEVVKSMGRAVGVDIADLDIQAVHRVPRFNVNATKNIVVQFCSMWKKNSIIQACARFRKENNFKISAKAINSNLPDQVIFVSEHLSPKYKALLGKVKKQIKDAGWKYVWTRHGCIYVKKDETVNNRIMISCEEDLLKIK